MNKEKVWWLEKSSDSRKKEQGTGGGI